jgi:NADH:ubiquinone reductase (H+-translocating)
LRNIGFTVRTGTRVTAAEVDGLRLGDGSKQPADLMVWAAGVKAPDFLGKLDGIAANRSNQVSVRPTLQVSDNDNIFALGDCSTLKLADDERPLAPTAQVATQQAQFLAKHLPNWLAGSSLPDFAFFRGGFIKGRIAQLSHAMLYRQHQQALHGFGKASLLWTAERINGLVQPKIRLS